MNGSTIEVMHIKSKILFWTLGVFIILSVSASYYRYMVLHDYIIEAQIDCDPTLESCFVWVCDLEAGEECTGNEDEDTWYYKYIYRNAKNIPLCDPKEEGCDALICPEGGELECERINCTSESLASYEITGECTNTVDFDEEPDTSAEDLGIID